MEIGLEFVAGSLVGAALAYLAIRAFRAAPPSPQARHASVASVASDESPSASPAEAQEVPRNEITREFDALMDSVANAIESIRDPEQLHRRDDFAAAAKLLAESETSVEVVLGYALDSRAALSCVALEALRLRGVKFDDPFQTLAVALRGSPGARVTALRYIREVFPGPLLGRVLASLDFGLINQPFFAPWFAEFVAERKAKGESPTDESAFADLDADSIDIIAASIESIPHPDVVSLRHALVEFRARREQRELLATVGRTLDPNARQLVVDHPTLASDLAAAEARIGDAETPRARRRSLLVVGSPGTGKTCFVRRLALRLAGGKRPILEATGSDVIAGQKFIGEHEDRAKRLLAALRDLDAIWLVPRFQELAYSGRHQENPTSTLDLVVPAIERGEIQLIGELSTAAADTLLRRFPRLRTLFDIFRVDPLPDLPARGLAFEVLKRRDESTAADRIAGGFGATPLNVIAEAQQLASAYLTETESPGRLLALLERAIDDVVQNECAARPLSRDDLLRALARLSGLPATILDDAARLEPADLAAHFGKRVIGQEEAVRVLVDRIAMLKAGLCDPKRPIGVFLFTGPTGTGKTELAKTLAEYLFGSADRMLRYDMGEFQSPESIDLILGASGGATTLIGSQALVDRIREQPFAVILLDEFEKAHPAVFDVFLQLFDDGRLTDRHGNTAHFRHAIIIMTSNLGGDIARDSSIGFRGERADPVARALASAFRKEFLNRIDRVVAFQPLSRAVMRDILLKELAAVLERRGLRNRQWAFEWENSAVEFLLERGFTHDLGARPLRRAIEQHLLAPLAKTILEHRAPQGDQFLFVRSSGERLEVEFVDPDAPAEEHAGAAVAGAGALRLRDVVLDATGDPSEVAALGRELERLRGVFRGANWKERKQALFDAMGSPGFWSGAERFVTLGEAEYRDRLEVGFDSAESLWQRLSSHAGEMRDRFPAALSTRLAHDLYLLDEALAGLDRGEAADAWVLIESEAPEGASARAGADAEAVRRAERVTEMYGGFAVKRRMRYELLADSRQDGSGDRLRMLLSISGFAAYSILRHDHGIHLFEIRGENDKPVRHRVRVRVLPQPAAPPPKDRAEHAALALAAFAAANAPLGISRRYTEEPSPLVRDAVRAWRTGRLDRVLAGDFDLFA
jgi:ATP-dependent Clp protease ATP-binding subunit ClpC